jgi:hypothetical protein
MKNLKIGITISLMNYSESIWTNGLKQNILMFIHLLKQSKNNYEVFLLNTNKVEGDDAKKGNYLKDIDIFYFDDKYMEMDLIFPMGSQIHEEKVLKFKESGNKKYVAYKCGNNYVLHMEKVLFDENKKKYMEIETTFDEVWYIPQQHETNYGYYNTLYRTNAIMVPFIWHHKFLLESVKEIEQGFIDGKYKKGYKYQPFKEKKTIGVMEPNINIVKYALIPTMITEECYRGEIGKKNINSLMITNAQNLKTNHEFMGLIKTFDLYKDGKVTGEGRYQTAFVLSQYVDILVCHQVLNPLNYLYLDAAFLGYPVLHNAPLCKDLGYYYEGSDTVEGSKQLNYILTEHDNNLTEYHERNDKVLQRYHADNEMLVETYDKMIYNLFNGGNKHLIYNPKTNLYDNL